MKKKGIALLLALFTLLIISLLVVVLFELTATDLQISSNHYLKNQALYIADAGVEYGLSTLKSGAKIFPYTAELPSGSGNTYSVNYNASSGIITSTGRLSSGEQVRLEAKVSVTGVPYRVKIIYWREVYG